MRDFMADSGVFPCAHSNKTVQADIGKTRHADSPAQTADSERAPGKARGILRHAPGPGVFHHARIAPALPLAGVVQHFWIVRWDLEASPPQVRETLPHPNVHWVFEPGLTRIQGVHTGRFTRELKGRGGVFGVKFRPGGFRAYLGKPLSALRDASLDGAAVFGDEAAVLEAELFAARNDAEQVAVAERFFLARLPLSDADALRAGEIVDAIAADLSIGRVEQVSERWRIGARSLQRLFNEYVGVGPKWVINRYRLHEALERLAQGGEVDWAQLALDLGYFDQAHFIRDFKALVGRPPADYARRG